MRKFKVAVIAQDMYSGIQEYSPPPETTVEEMIKHVQTFVGNEIAFSESDFRAFAYNQGRWLRKDEILCDIPLEEDTVVLVAKSLIDTIGDSGDSVEFFKRIADITVLRQWIRPEDQILRVLNELKDEHDTEESLLEKANSIIQLQPNIAGLGINLNELVKRVLGRK